MTKEEILIEYCELLNIIDMHGIAKFKEWVEEYKNDLPLSNLTIASSIIAVLDILEKKEKK